MSLAAILPELLAALSNHAQGWLDHAANLLQREGVAVQVQRHPLGQTLIVTAGCGRVQR